MGHRLPATKREEYGYSTEPEQAMYGIIRNEANSVCAKNKKEWMNNTI